MQSGPAQRFGNLVISPFDVRAVLIGAADMATVEGEYSTVILVDGKELTVETADALLVAEAITKGAKGSAQPGTVQVVEGG